MKLLATLAAVATLATPAGYVQAQQREDGSFGDAPLTAWATLGLVAAGKDTGRAAEYLRSRSRRRRPTARSSPWRAPPPATGRTTCSRHCARTGPASSSTRRSGRSSRSARPVSPHRPRSCRRSARAQRPNGGWSWLAGGAADANDTAAAIQALRAAGVKGRPIDRGVAFLRRHQNRDGGFELTLDRGSDTQSTAWAIQALLAAGRQPGAPAFRYLARMRRPDGSYRYNARYVTTPLWVTAQVLPALARKPFPLRGG